MIQTIDFLVTDQIEEHGDVLAILLVIGWHLSDVVVVTDAINDGFRATFQALYVAGRKQDFANCEKRV